MLNVMDALVLTISLGTYVALHGYVVRVLNTPAFRREMEHRYNLG